MSALEPSPPPPPPPPPPPRAKDTGPDCEKQAAESLPTETYHVDETFVAAFKHAVHLDSSLPSAGSVEPALRPRLMYDWLDCLENGDLEDVCTLLNSQWRRSRCEAGPLRQDLCLCLWAELLALWQASEIYISGKENGCQWRPSATAQESSLES